MDILVGQLVGLFVWLVANAVYVTSRRQGTGGFRRFLAFWMGLPVTFFVMLLVPEGSQPALEPPPDDDDALLAEVRRDRALRPGESGDGTESDTSEEEEEGV